MRVFVTGGAGFIGSHTVAHLIAHGVDVRIYDDLSTGALENLRRLEEREQFVRGDILDYEALRAAMHGCDAVIHLAAIVSVPASVSRAAHTHAVNATGTLNVLEAARAEGIRRVVLASSAAVYGDGGAEPLAEDLAPCARSPYAAQKWLNEAYADIYARVHGLSPICLRYFNVYGPRQSPQSPYSGVLSRFMAAAAARRPVTIHGDGQQTRDFVFVKDVARANWHALIAPPTTAGEVYNIGTGSNVSVIEAYHAIVRRLGEAPPVGPVFEPARVGDVRHSCAAVGRARDQLGFSARVSLPDGLGATLAWLRNGDIDLRTALLAS